jgi:hypothetical protein
MLLVTQLFAWSLSPAADLRSILYISISEPCPDHPCTLWSRQFTLFRYMSVPLPSFRGNRTQFLHGGVFVGYEHNIFPWRISRGCVASRWRTGSQLMISLFCQIFLHFILFYWFLADFILVVYYIFCCINF